jgi:hypothetical protein
MTLEDASQECKYISSLLVTSQALSIAMGSLEFACRAIEAGTPSSYALTTIRKDLAKIDGLMRT